MVDTGGGSCYRLGYVPHPLVNKKYPEAVGRMRPSVNEFRRLVFRTHSNGLGTPDSQARHQNELWSTNRKNRAGLLQAISAKRA